jgi:hypothetical protein
MRAPQGLAITFAEADELDLAFPVAGMSRDIQGEGALFYFTSSTNAPTVCSMGTVGSVLSKLSMAASDLSRGRRGISLTYVHNIGQCSRRRVSRETFSGPP